MLTISPLHTMKDISQHFHHEIINQNDILEIKVRRRRRRRRQRIQLERKDDIYFKDQFKQLHDSKNLQRPLSRQLSKYYTQYKYRIYLTLRPCSKERPPL